MEKKQKNNKLRTLVLYVLFGSVMTFAVTVLVYWIFAELVNPIWMALVIGALVGIAFKLFANAIAREDNRE